MHRKNSNILIKTVTVVVWSVSTPMAQVVRAIWRNHGLDTRVVFDTARGKETGHKIIS